MSAGVPYVKMNGIGNEIVVLDLRDRPERVSAAAARAIAATPGAHFDQLMVLYPPETAGTLAFMRIFNIDGSESFACGNGTRCVARQLFDAGAGPGTLTLETRAGLLAVTDHPDGLVTVDMGAPRLGWAEIPLSRPADDTRAVPFRFADTHGAPALENPAAVNMGNPHAIFFVDDIPAYDLARIGPVLEHDPLFPERANISLAHVTAPDALTLKVWERGAGLTLACGSAACAAAVAAARTGRTGRTVRVSLPGGDLVIEWTPANRILMTGATEFEHDGRLPAAVFAADVAMAGAD